MNTITQQEAKASLNPNAPPFFFMPSSIFLSKPSIHPRVNSDRLPSVSRRDLRHNQIDTLNSYQPSDVAGLSANSIETDDPEKSHMVSGFSGLAQLQDILLGHNNITKIDSSAFKGLTSLQIL